MALQTLYNLINHPLTWDDVNEVLKLADDNFTFVASATTTGDLSAISQDIIPDGIQNWDIGSADKPWDNLFVNNINVGSIDADLVGSVFSDGSTMLVDGTNGVIPGTLTGQWNSPGNTFNVFGEGVSVATGNSSLAVDDDGLGLLNNKDGVLTFSLKDGGMIFNGNGNVGYTANQFAVTVTNDINAVAGGDVTINTSNDLTLLGTNITLTGNVDIQSLSGNLTGTMVGEISGNLTGSVWSDDSTGLLIDGTEGTINTHKLSQVSATDGQALVWSDSNERWEPGTVSGAGVSLGSRTTKSATTGSIANGATGNTNVLDAFKGYALLKIETNAAAWVRVYVSEAARTADASRLESEDPSPDSGVIAEVITTGAETVLISPGVFGFNNENPVTNTIPLAVTNKTGGTTTITVTLTMIQLEA